MKGRKDKRMDCKATHRMQRQPKEKQVPKGTVRRGSCLDAKEVIEPALIN